MLITTVRRRFHGLSRMLAVWFLAGNVAYATGPAWVQAISAGGSGSDVGNAVKTDQSGNRYVTGSFSATAQFGSQTLTSHGGSDVFLAKYGPGGKLLWIVQAGGIWDDIGSDVAVGAAGNIYITGKVIEKATFQSLNGPSKTVSGINEIIFLAKYSPTGTLLWLQTGIPLGGSNDGFGLAVQPATGTVFLTGRAQGQVTFSSSDGTQHTISSVPMPWQMYLVKYDQNGNFQWGEWNEPNPNTVGYNSIGTKVAADSSGSAYVTGWFEVSSTFRSADGNDVTVTGFSGPPFFPVYPNNAFIVKYDRNGNVKWVNEMGGYKAEGMDVAVSPTGEISLVGFIGNINDGTPAQAMTIVTSQPGGTDVNLGGGKFTSPYNKDVVIATYNNSGVLLKATRLGGSQDEVGIGIAYDHKGNLYVDGVFQAGFTIQDHFLTGTQPYNLFLMKQVPSGWVTWAKKADGAGTNAFEEGIAVESEDTVLVTGAFQNTATFGGLTLNGAGEDVYLAELKGGPCTFTFFPLTANLPNGTTFSMSPNGVNDFGTVIGTGFTDTTPVNNFGFVRSADGAIKLVNGTTSLVDRNDLKVSIGYNASDQVLVDSSGTITPLELSFNNNGFSSRGINNWGNIVGSYNTSSSTSGFKRFSNGGTVKLGFPGASSTFPTSINDHGMIVGSYFVGSGGGQLPQNGFIYSQGSWATLNYPGSLSTNLVGVSNNGVIVGNATDLGLAFRYENGQFKTIVGPNGVGVTVTGISPRFGLIAGTAGPKGGFVATCQ
jgi:hypothetical protein